MTATTIIVFNTGFSIQYWNRFSFEQFLQECLASKVFNEYCTEERVALLKTVYDLIINA